MYVITLLLPKLCRCRYVLCCVIYCAEMKSRKLFTHFYCPKMHCLNITQNLLDNKMHAVVVSNLRWHKKLSSLIKYLSTFRTFVAWIDTTIIQTSQFCNKHKNVCHLRDLNSRLYVEQEGPLTTKLYRHDVIKRTPCIFKKTLNDKYY